MLSSKNRQKSFQGLYWPVFNGVFFVSSSPSVKIYFRFRELQKPPSPGGFFCAWNYNPDYFSTGVAPVSM